MSQNSFQRVFLEVFSGIDAEYCLHSVFLPNGNIASIGVNDGCEPCSPVFYFRLTDPQGNEIRRNIYGAGPSLIFPDMVQTSDGNLVFSFGSVESPSGQPNDLEYDFHLVKVDTSGNTLADKMYILSLDLPITSQRLQLYPTNDSGVVVTTPEHFFRVNSLLDSTLLGLRNNFRTFKDNSNDLYGFFRLDTTGGIQQRLVEYFNSNFDSIKSIYFDSLTSPILFSSGWSISTICTDFQGNSYISLFDYIDNDSVVFIKVDSLFQELWRKYLPSNFVASIASRVDTGGVLFAGIIDPIGPTTWTGHNFLYRFSINGDSLNYREFLSANVYPFSEIYDIEYQNGYYLLSGYAKSDTSVQKSYLAVIDTSLNISLNSENFLSKESFKIFPQPANEIVNFAFPSVIKSIYIRNIYSQNLFQRENLKVNNLTINSSFLKTGVYFITVEYINSSKATERIEIIH